MGIYDITFYDVINRNAISFQNGSAWFEADDQTTLTFREYKDGVDRLAGGLIQAGLQKGDRIGILGKNSLEYFFLFGAAAAIGAIVLPINWRLSIDEIIFNLNDGTPKILFVDAEFQEMIESAGDRFPSVGNRYNLKADEGGFSGFKELMKKSSAIDPVDISSDDGFVIIHTAAVTGRPRGAYLSHGNILAASVHMIHLFNLVHTDVHLNLLPLFHVAGLTMAIKAFHAGALNVNMSKFDAAQAVELIADKNVSVLYEFSPILSSILDAQAETGRDIKCLRAILGVDVPATIERYQKLAAGTFHCVYGQAETSGLATLGTYDDKPGSAGKILHLADVRLVDDHDRFVPTGQIGEITVRGPLVFKGYWNLPEDTAYTFRGGRHHTGDLGRFDEDGFLWFEGRKPEKELIKPGGENVYPAEVERVILEHPDVELSVVFGVPDPKWKEGIKAVCQLKSGQTLEPEALIHFVGERIASYKKPKHVEFVKAFPLLNDGSPDRARIKAGYGGEQVQKK